MLCRDSEKILTNIATRWRVMIAVHTIPWTVLYVGIFQNMWGIKSAHEVRGREYRGKHLTSM